MGAIHSTKIPTSPTGKRGPTQKVDPFFRNFSGWTEPIHWVLDRNFRKFWLNGSRPMCGYCLSATNHIRYWVTSSNTRFLLGFDISQSRSTRYPLPVGSMWYFSFFSMPLLYTQVMICAEQSLIWSQRALIQRWSNRIDKVRLGFFFFNSSTDQ